MSYCYEAIRSACSIQENYSYIHFIIISADLTISFDQSSYNVNENSGLSQHVIVLSNPSSRDIDFLVVDNSITAVGESTGIICYVSAV